MLRVVTVQELSPAQHAVLGWNTADLEAGIDSLCSKGVVFERFPSLVHDHRGVWTSPGGAKVAWFKDPDGNLLSLTQFTGIGLE